MVPSLRVPVSGRAISRRLTEGHLVSRRPLRVPPLTTNHRRLCLEWCLAKQGWTAAEWNTVVYSDESRFSLNSDDGRVHVWRPCGQRLNPAFHVERFTAPSAGVLVWGAISFDSRSPLVVTRGTLTAQRYVQDILRPHVMPLMAELSEAIFQQDNARPHSARVSQECLRQVETLPWPARSPDLSIIEHVWDYLGCQVGHPTRLADLEAQLQRLWAKMPQNIIRNLYDSIPARIASCIHARGGAIGY